MPIHFASSSRRRFLGAATLLGGGWLTRFESLAAEDGSQSFALLSDTHISADPEAVLRETHLCNNLKSVVAEVKAMPQPAAAVLLNGDAALNTGLREDYQQLINQLAPLMGQG